MIPEHTEVLSHHQHSPSEDSSVADDEVGLLLPVINLCPLLFLLAVTVVL